MGSTIRKSGGNNVLAGWCFFAAALLFVSLIVHLSTFVGIDPIARWPGVMFLHAAIFPPFIAGLYYLARTGENQNKVFHSAPLWLRILAAVIVAYAAVNWMLVFRLSEGGSPDEQDGKYVLHNHGTVIRELSEAEFHRHQAYVVRGFSGHWMLFACASLTMLVGAAKLRSDKGETTTITPATSNSSIQSSDFIRGPNEQKP